MSTALARYGFGTRWTDIHTDSYESYHPNMTDYHMHDVLIICAVGGPHL